MQNKDLKQCLSFTHFTSTFAEPKEQKTKGNTQHNKSCSAHNLTQKIKKLLKSAKQNRVKIY